MYRGMPCRTPRRQIYEYKVQGPTYPLDCVDGRGGGVCVGRQEGGPQHATRSDHDVASSTQQRALAYGPRLHASLAWVWRSSRYLDRETHKHVDARCRPANLHFYYVDLNRSPIERMAHVPGFKSV